MVLQLSVLLWHPLCEERLTSRVICSDGAQIPPTRCIWAIEVQNEEGLCHCFLCG